MRDSLFALFFLLSFSSAFADVPGRVVQYRVIPRDSHMKQFPCQECHKSYRQGKVDLSDLKDKHAHIKFKHLPEINECSLCHSTTRPNELNLLDGTLITVNESYRLCEQCHGTRTFDWRRGMHGRVEGHWMGDRSIHNCTSCHEAHDPKFPLMEADPAPAIPRFVIKKTEKGH